MNLYSNLINEYPLKLAFKEAKRYTLETLSINFTNSTETIKFDKLGFGDQTKGVKIIKGFKNEEKHRIFFKNINLGNLAIINPKSKVEGEKFNTF